MADFLKHKCAVPRNLQALAAVPTPETLISPSKEAPTALPYYGFINHEVGVFVTQSLLRLSGPRSASSSTLYLGLTTHSV